MSDFVALILVGAFVLQSVAFGAFVVRDSVMSQRLRRVAEELVMLRASARGGACGGSSNGAGGCSCSR